MDSETINIFKTSSKKRIFTLILSVVNLIFLCGLFFSALSHFDEASNYHDSHAAICMIMILIVLFLVGILKLIKAVWIRNICDVRFCLEYFLVLFVLNIVPMTSTVKRVEFDLKYSCSNYTNSCYLEKENTKKDYLYLHNFILMSSTFFYVIIGLKIYFVYLYYNYELKCSQQNILPVSPLCENPSIPTEQCQMASSQNKCISQPTNQPGQNLTQPLQYIIQQPGQYVIQQHEQYETQQPVTSAYNPAHIAQISMQTPHVQMPMHPPHMMQISVHPHQSMPNYPRQDLNLQSEEPMTQKSVKLTSNPPPYSRSEDM